MRKNADWISELPSAIKKNNNTTHHSIKMTPIQASEESNEKIVYNNLKDDREKTKIKLGDLVRTANIKRIFSKVNSANWSYNLYTITEVIYDTLPSCRINYLPERYNRNLLLPTKLSLDENEQCLKELNLIH